VRFTSTTNGSGDYILPFLIPGPYSLTVESRGFKTYRRAGIVVRESESHDRHGDGDRRGFTKCSGERRDSPAGHLDGFHGNGGRAASYNGSAFQGRHGAHHGHSNAGRDLHAPNGRICAPVRYEFALNYVGQRHALGKQRVHGRWRE